MRQRPLAYSHHSAPSLARSHGGQRRRKRVGSRDGHGRRHDRSGSEAKGAAAEHEHRDDHAAVDIEAAEEELADQADHEDQAEADLEQDLAQTGGGGVRS